MARFLMALLAVAFAAVIVTADEPKAGSYDPTDGNRLVDFGSGDIIRVAVRLNDG